MVKRVAKVIYLIQEASQKKKMVSMALWVGMPIGVNFSGLCAFVTVVQLLSSSMSY